MPARWMRAGFPLSLRKPTVASGGTRPWQRAGAVPGTTGRADQAPGTTNGDGAGPQVSSRRWIINDRMLRIGSGVTV
jgi:hypothetical protein